MFGGFLHARYGTASLVTQLPVTLDRHLAIFQRERVRRRQFAYAFVNRQWRGHVIERKILAQRVQIQVRSD